MSNAQKAVIESISDNVKTKSNGKNYITCVVKFLDGMNANKTFFANRTLGENKSPIKVGQEVNCLPSSLVGEDGKKIFFLEISTGVAVTGTNEDLLAQFGL